MKIHLRLTSLFLLFQLLCFAQGTYKRLSTCYAYNFNLQLISDTSIIFSSDNGYASLVNNQTFKWHKLPAFSSTPFIGGNFIKTSDSTYSAFGYTYDSPVNLATIVSFTKNGVFKSAKSLSSITSSFTSVIPMDKNRILALSGHTFAKLDYAGNPISIKKISSLYDIDIAYGHSVLNKINNNLFITTLTNYDHNTRQQDLTIIAVDSSLNVLWAKTSGGKQDDKPMCGLDLEARHYTLSQTNSFGVGKTDILISCRDNAGTILWNKTVGSEQFNEYALDVTIDKDSNLLISGYVNQKVNDKEQGLLIKVTADGDPI